MLVDAGLCQQPAGGSWRKFASSDLPDDEEVIIPDCEPDTPTDSCIIAVDPLSCAVVPAYATYTQEVDFGRTSVIRAPDTVLEQSLGEVITKVATAQCTTLDPAGRLVNTSRDR